MFASCASDNVLVYLIQQSVDGSPERRLAGQTSFSIACGDIGSAEEIEGCIHDLADKALLDVAKDARELALNVGLIR